MHLKLFLALLAIFLLASGSRATTGDLQAEETTSPPPSLTNLWHKDADCRMVFFAVLEGLYENGVSTETVDLILGNKKQDADKVRHSFVFRCNLCHAVYEAFVLYQGRQTFNGSNVNTFAKSEISEDIMKGLRSEKVINRVYAMGKLIRPWIRQKVQGLRLDETGKQELIQRLSRLVDEGKKRLKDQQIELGKSDPELGNEWRFYGGCQACEAVDVINKMLQDDTLNPDKNGEEHSR